MQTPSFKISIPHPCTQSWDSMTPSGGGRHCAYCDKVVTDFSGMSDQQVQDFFTLHHGESVCGRFRKVQLDRIRIQVPSYILRKRIPGWKKYLAILLICFGSSVFSFDVALGNRWNPGAKIESTNYRQGEIIKKDEVKKKKKSTHKIIADFSFPQFSDTAVVMGAIRPREVVSPPDYSSILAPRLYPAALLTITCQQEKKTASVKQRSSNQ